MAESRLRTVRVPDDQRWERAQAKALGQGTSVSAVLNRALLEYAPAPEPEPERARVA